jgi:hypothetical protein
MPVAEAHVDGEKPLAESPRVRARLVAVSVQLELVTDDGVHDYVTPLPVQPIRVAAADWAAFDVDAQVADVQRQIDEVRR